MALVASFLEKPRSFSMAANVSERQNMVPETPGLGQCLKANPDPLRSNARGVFFIEITPLCYS